jgi:NAD(P)-dependent dehydrogenase (short-subunit alcohol dehydrogenase family)
MGKLDGKVALLTGSFEGIGFAAADKELDGKDVTAVQGDISNLDVLDRLFSLIKQHKGHLDILFVNARMSQHASLDSITEKHYNDVFNVNVKGVLFTVQKALPIIVDGGAIILTASAASIKGGLNRSVYNASKAAVRSFTRC